MTDRYEIDFSDDPVFETVTGLTNTTFNINNITEDRMATEGQLLTIANRINDLQNRINYCCNDIVTWKTYVRVIAENSHIVLKDWDSYVVVGTTRKNNPFTVYFELPLDTEKFYPNVCQWKSVSNRAQMHIKVNITGKASLCESLLISDAMNMDKDVTSGVTPEGRTRTGFAQNIIGSTDGKYSHFPAYSGSPNNPGNNSVTQNIPVYNINIPESEIENNPFPIISSDGAYRVYLDGDTVKVDVITKSHFAENDYVASFFIQYVLREGMTL